MGALVFIIIVLLFCAGDSDPGWPPSSQGPMRRTSGPFVTFTLACPGVSLLGDFRGLCCHGKDKAMEERTGQNAGGQMDFPPCPQLCTISRLLSIKDAAVFELSGRNTDQLEKEHIILVILQKVCRAKVKTVERERSNLATQCLQQCRDKFQGQRLKSPLIGRLSA